jgi:adenylate cyclase
MSEGTQRRLAAIVAADVVAYSRLMGVDEAGTLAALRKHRAELIDAKVAEHGGRIVKTMGDGLLLEFPSVVDATQCVIDVQQAMAIRNEALDDDKRIVFRIGVHLGDLVVEGDDIFGDGINIAARLEALCEAGGVAISGTAHENIAGRIEVGFVDAGDQQLKNISRPVRVWQWTPAASAMSTTGEALALPDKPSIAILPFDNMSGDPEQEYFSDGITEDIIMALSRLRWLFVIARNSTFTYKGRAVDVKQVGREMGVRYVLEGSVRKSGQRIRVTAQLIEAETGNYIWAERYDRELADIFDLQDELTQAISAQVDAELSGNERQQAHNKTTTNLDAWELYQRGMWHYYHNTREELVEARRLFGLALVQAPEFASANAAFSLVAYGEVLRGYSIDRAATLEQGLSYAERAVALDSREVICHYALGRICMLLGDSDRTIRAMEKCIDLNPSSAQSYYGLGYALFWFGRAENAVPYLTRAIRLSPHDPYLWAFYHMRGTAHSHTDDFASAVDDVKAAIQVKGDEIWPYLVLAFSCSSLGRTKEARAALDRAREINPKVSAKFYWSVCDTLHPPYAEKMLDALRKAGLPEE